MSANPEVRPEVRAGRLLRARATWLFPMTVGSVLVILMTLVYFGSVVDPTEHLHGLPVHEGAT